MKTGGDGYWSTRLTLVQILHTDYTLSPAERVQGEMIRYSVVLHLAEMCQCLRQALVVLVRVLCMVSCCLKLHLEVSLRDPRAGWDL